MPKLVICEETVPTGVHNGYSLSLNNLGKTNKWIFRGQANKRGGGGKTGIPWTTKQNTRFYKRKKNTKKYNPLSSRRVGGTRTLVVRPIQKNSYFSVCLPLTAVLFLLHLPKTQPSIYTRTVIEFSFSNDRNQENLNLKIKRKKIEFKSISLHWINIEVVWKCNFFVLRKSFLFFGFYFLKSTLCLYNELFPNHMFFPLVFLYISQC